MPLTEKGKKLKKKFREQYGKKKGDSVFYAMENSGKLKKVIKAKGGKDASKDNFGGSGAVDTGDFGSEAANIAANKAATSFVGDGGQKKIKNVTVTKGPNLINEKPFGIFTPVSYQLATKAINLGKKQAFERKNLKKQKEVDVLGGEMLTTAPQKLTKPKGTGDNVKPIQPIQPISTTKKIDQTLVKPKDNFFNFISYKVGGLSGGVSYGPPPKRGPNPQVPPIKMKRGGQK
tara:strand:+ start:560 stop:1255 length:696 start_codon:yes stop_codon:yes gene_type:complete